MIISTPIGEYKISSYTSQKLDNKTLVPTGRKKTRYAIYQKEYPFPNKTIFMWLQVKDGFKTEKEAEMFLEEKLAEGCRKEITGT